MNARQWRAGRIFKTIFANGSICLWKPSEPFMRYRPVNGGEWMDYDDLGDWVKTFAPKSFSKIAAACYCDNGVGTCDFCAGIRPAPEIETMRRP